jgi:tetratricopeptide (TPR) repeat protein
VRGSAGDARELQTGTIVWMPHLSTTLRYLRLSVAAATLLATANAAFGDGPGAYRPREQKPAASAKPTDEQSAIDAYNEGYALIQRAEHYESLASASSSERERSAAANDARACFEKSLAKFSAAVKFDPSMHEAQTYLGYANRKLGRHAAALTAYEQALRINPDYPHAIEYQGQAFLGLNRVEEAKFNYLRLYALNQAQAHKLLRAIRAWADAHSAQPPEGIDMTALSLWIAERERSHDPNESSSAW